MLDIIFPVFILIAALFAVWLFCAFGCEYRRYEGGHFLFKAFRAKTPFQIFLTAFQSTKDIDPRDIGKLSVPGYAVSVLSALSGIAVVPLSVIMYIRGNKDFCMHAGGLWAGLSIGGGLLAGLLQGLDSLAARIFNQDSHSIINKPIHKNPIDCRPAFPGWIFVLGFVILLGIVAACLLIGTA